MNIGSKYYRTDIDDSDRAEELFETFVEETNADKYVASPGIDYIVTEESGTPEIYEIRRTNITTVAKAVILEDTVIEGQVAEEKVEEIKEWYAELE